MRAKSPIQNSCLIREDKASNNARAATDKTKKSKIPKPVLTNRPSTMNTMNTIQTKTEATISV